MNFFDMFRAHRKATDDARREAAHSRTKETEELREGFKHLNELMTDTLAAMAKNPPSNRVDPLHSETTNKNTTPE